MEQNVDQSPLAEIVKKPVEVFGKLKSFWKTRSAIKAGLPLYDWSSSQLKEKGYLGPWGFNATETLLATVPAFVCVKFLDLLFGKVEDPTIGSQFGDGKDEVFIRTLNSVYDAIDTITIPLLFTVAVVLTGWGSLRGKDSTPESRSKARRAYLYFDGTYGIFLQAAMVFMLISRHWAETHPEVISKLNSLLIAASILVFLVAAILQSRLIGLAIPRMLFKLNGYSGRRKQFWQKKLPDDPPWSRYTFAVFVGGYPTLIFIQLTLVAIAWGIAWTVDTIQLSFIK